MNPSAYQLDAIKVFYQQQPVLDIPHLELMHNQCIALLGDNGAGKSTLLDLLAFTQTPSEGRIIFSGDPITRSLTPKQRKSIGYVSQQPYLLSGSVKDNIQLALQLQGITPRHYGPMVDQALTLANIRHLANHPANALSGGELKRVAIARAVSYQPEILLLDEPFSHLDRHHIDQLEDIIQQLVIQHGKTVIFSTHDRLRALALTDQTVNLVHGKTTQSPLLNLYHGQLHNQRFETGQLDIYTTSDNQNARHIAIDPHEIVISSQPLNSSMRNHFKGRLTSITEEANTVRLVIDCGERFHAIISQSSFTNLNLMVGSEVWISFKSSAVTVF